MDFDSLISFENSLIIYNHKFIDNSFPKLFISFKIQNQKFNCYKNHLLLHYHILHFKCFCTLYFRDSQNIDCYIQFSGKCSSWQK